MIKNVSTFVVNPICIFLLLCIVFVLPCSAMDTGFAVEDVGVDDTSAIFEKLELKVIDEPKVDTGFSCFDVNESGEYVLGFGLTNNDAVLVYDSDGTYLYGFSFSNNGSLGVEWDNDAIILYLVRSDLAVSVNKSGNCIAMKKIQNTTQNSEYWNQKVFANKRDINGASFSAKHWLLNNEHLHWGAYQRLVKTTPNGETVILFDATTNSFVVTQIIITFAIISLLLITVILFVYRLKHKTA